MPSPIKMMVYSSFLYLGGIWEQNAAEVLLGDSSLSQKRQYSFHLILSVFVSLRMLHLETQPSYFMEARPHGEAISFPISSLILEEVSCYAIRTFKQSMERPAWQGTTPKELHLLPTASEELRPPANTYVTEPS